MQPQPEAGEPATLLLRARRRRGGRRTRSARRLPARPARLTPGHRHHPGLVGTLGLSRSLLPDAWVGTCWVASPGGFCDEPP